MDGIRIIKVKTLKIRKTVVVPPFIEDSLSDGAALPVVAENEEKADESAVKVGLSLSLTFLK